MQPYDLLAPRLKRLSVSTGLQFIYSAIGKERGSVYVHCRRGRVRCVMMCTAFIMVWCHLDPLAAESLVILHSWPANNVDPVACIVLTRDVLSRVELCACWRCAARRLQF